MDRENVPEELRRLTRQYTEDENASIPCPDCHNPPPLDAVIAEIIKYCPLCDGTKVVTKARALAVLPQLSEFIQTLRNDGGR